MAVGWLRRLWRLGLLAGGAALLVRQYRDQVRPLFRDRTRMDASEHQSAPLTDELRKASMETLADYGAVAEGYAAGNANHDVSQNINALLDALSDRPAPLDILDVGCAGGRDLATFTRMGHHAVGLDGVQAFCEMARSATGCEVWQQDFQELSLPPASFDGIFANACLFHIPSASLPGTLRELARTLRDGGSLFVSNAHGFGEDKEGWTSGRTPGTQSYVCWLSEETWNRYCRDAGFELIKSFYRPPGKPRSQQPFLATVWRKPHGR